MPLIGETSMRRMTPSNFMLQVYPTVVMQLPDWKLTQYGRTVGGYFTRAKRISDDEVCYLVGVLRKDEVVEIHLYTYDARKRTHAVDSFIGNRLDYYRTMKQYDLKYACKASNE